MASPHETSICMVRCLGKGTKAGNSPLAEAARAGRGRQGCASFLWDRRSTQPPLQRMPCIHQVERTWLLCPSLRIAFRSREKISYGNDGGQRKLPASLGIHERASDKVRLV